MAETEQRIVVKHMQGKQVLEEVIGPDLEATEGWRVKQMQVVPYQNAQYQIACCVVLWQERPRRKGKGKNDETHS